ncbi:MAG TPA: DUF4961 domain-containing protein [Panacibacter sp.]|nr:DUF4961 domain-containing protein [Panacibacter sp.]
MRNYKDNNIKIKTKKRKYFWIYPSLIVIAFILADCGVFFNEDNPVDEPISVKAGDTMSVVLHTKYDIFGDKLGLHLVGGILVPKSWNAAQNSTAFFTSTITTGIQQMSIIPANEIPFGSDGLNWAESVTKKYGFGSNVINDLEWVIFWSNNTYDVTSADNHATADITINVKTGTENLQYKRGYFLSESIDAFSTSQYSDWQFVQGFFTNCFNITDGTGDLIDFCNPQIGAGEPSNAKAGDIVTIKYDGDLDASDLKNAGDIFLCAKAYTTAGQTIDVCLQEDKSKMVLWGSNKWRMDLWPAKYFNLKSGEELSKIEYYFTDKTGTIKTGYANTAAPFVYKFKCN